MKKQIIIAIIIALAAAHCPAAPVELPDSGGFAVEDVASGDEPFAPWSFAADDSRDPALSAEVDAGCVEVEKPGTRIPIAVKGGTGQETRLGVDVAGINAQAEREGWPTWAKVTVIVGGVAVVALASWAIVEATQNGEHTSGDDSSTHYNIGVGGEGNTVHVKIDSPDTTTTRNGY